MNIYLSTTTDFDNNGLGFLTDITSVKVFEEINGKYQIEFTYPRKGYLSEYLIEENIIKSKVSDGSSQLFVIKTIQKDLNIIKVTAFHIFYNLLNNILEDVYPKNLDAHSFLEHILNHTQFEHDFISYSDITGRATARYVRKNPVETIMSNSDNSMVNLFGGEIKRDNFKISLLQRLGADNGVKLYLGKNITGIDVTIDISDVATRIMPIGYEGLILPEKYIDSPLINNYPTPKIRVIEFSDVKVDPEDENAFKTEDEAYDELRRLTNEQFTNGIDKASINVKIDWVELSKTNEYKEYSNLEKVNLGDTITAYILGLDYETRVISTIYNPLTDMIEKFEIGNVKPSFESSVNKIKDSVKEINPNLILSEAKINATNLITHAMGGYVYKTQNELYIMDTNDITTAKKVWRWNINGLGYSSTGINGTYGLAMTMEGQIVADFITTGKLNTNVIEGYNDLVLKVNDFSSQAETIAKIEMDLEKINSEIGSITDTTVSASGTGTLILDNVLTSELLYLQVYPTYTDLSYLYPADDLFPSDDLFLLSRDIVFTSEENEVIFTLPCDLLFIDSTIRDELIINYDTQEMYVIHRVGLDEDGNKYALSEATTEYFDYSGIILPDGDYIVSMPSFEDAYIYVRSLAKNLYTAQYATKVELNSAITSTTTSINARVDEKITLVNGDIDELSGRLDIQADEIALKLDASKFTSSAVIGLINNRDGTSSALIKATNIDMSGTNFNLTTQNMTISSTNFSVDKNGNATMNNANFNGTIKSSNGTIGGWNINSGGLNNGNVFINSNGYSSIYTIADYFIIKNYLLNKEGFEFGSVEISHYDLNGDGVVNSADLLAIRKMTLGY